MNRRSFLSSGFAAAAALRRRAPPVTASTIRLPATDTHYRKVQSYVEDVPVPEYRWASEAAYERFRDIKYGVRLHWGPYSILGEPGVLAVLETVLRGTAALPGVIPDMESTRLQRR